MADWVPFSIEARSGSGAGTSFGVGPGAAGEGAPPSWSDKLYVVVDDAMEGAVTLSVSVWPTLDAKGRLTFSDLPYRERVEVSAAVLERFLADHRRFLGDEPSLGPDPSADDQDQVQSFRRRPIRVGDVYCMSEEALASLKTARMVPAEPVEGGGSFGLPRSPGPAVPPTPAGPPVGGPEVYDISADARIAAKAAFYGAVGQPLVPGQDDDILSEARDERPMTPAGPAEAGA